MNLKKLFGLASLALIAFACNNDDDGGETMPSEPETTEKTFTVTIENLIPSKNYLHVEALPASALAPGQDTSITFNAGKDAYLSLATMFIESNDLFYAFNEEGLKLYDDNGTAVTGDVTNKISLWDAGTEENQQPGIGSNQPGRQSGFNTGAAENGKVNLVSSVNDGYTYPADENVIKVELAHDGGSLFTLTISNVSDESTFQTSLAPGLMLVHKSDRRLFNEGESAPTGLEELAEDGKNEIFLDILQISTGYSSPLSPGAWAVHSAAVKPMFDSGFFVGSNGIEELAEAGDPTDLASALSDGNGIFLSDVFDTPVGSNSASNIGAGGKYTFTFKADTMQRLSLATMLVESNDLFYAFGSTGISLFDGLTPISGDITEELSLWDAGTEVNEYPGAGNNQPLRGGKTTGEEESSTVSLVNDGFTYPALTDAIKVTIAVE